MTIFNTCTFSILGKSYFVYLLLLLTISIVLFSCDCVRNIDGTVIDVDSKKMIDSVYVQEKDRNNINTYTNDKGHFHLSDISGGLFSCPPMTVAFAKKGYEIKVVEIELNKNVTIYLQRIR